MLNFLAQNWGSLFVGAGVLAIVVLILLKIRRDKKKGQNSCGCSCGDCPSAGACHSK